MIDQARISWTEWAAAAKKSNDLIVRTKHMIERKQFEKRGHTILKNKQNNMKLLKS